MISLDHIASDGPLKVLTGSVSKEEDKDFAKDTLKSLKVSAALQEKSIEFSRKTNPSEFYEWEHIRFSDKGLVSLTITTL